MNPTQSDQYNLLAQFVLGRIFPAMADFSKANNLSISAPSGLLSYLLLLLFETGVTKEEIIILVEETEKAHFARKERTELPANPQEIPEQKLPDNVVRLGQRRK